MNEITADEVKKLANQAKTEEGIAKKKEWERENKPKMYFVDLNQELYEKTLKEIYSGVRRNAKDHEYLCSLEPKNFRFAVKKKIVKGIIYPTYEQKELIKFFAHKIADELEEKGFKVSYGDVEVAMYCDGPADLLMTISW
ncbi:MAG: hypothetical protein M1334_01690 [Patescibacteria group bacterium]|nr:hypothetical protein [Patescibacteria group bacterium]